MELIPQTIQAVRDRMAQAAQYAQRNPDDITLIAVSKQKPIADIIAAYEAGVRHFGENRTEELAEKSIALAHLTDLKWHFIGHLQSRQSQEVAKYAHYFHALDRVSIAEHLSNQLTKLDRQLSVFIQVNVSGEATKGGFICHPWQTQSQQLEILIQSIKQIVTLPNLSIQGLMTMAPWNASDATLHSIFKNMAELALYLPTQLSNLPILQLSMGMSGDFEIAIMEGATHVRVGSAIFGERYSK